MNSIIERVCKVCEFVRLKNPGPISFKTLVFYTRRAFKHRDFDIKIRLKKEKFLDNGEFYVMAYYDHEDDRSNETPIEVVVHYNFTGEDQWGPAQITDFLIQIFDAVVHEHRHQQQSVKRNYRVYSWRTNEPYEQYLADPDEVDAYALSIAIELIRHMGKERSQKYMRRITVMSKMRQGAKLVSSNLSAYISYFGLTRINQKLAKKIFKHLETIDKNFVFK